MQCTVGNVHVQRTIMVTSKRAKISRDPVATREAILTAARDLISKDGPEAVSVVRVANLAGVNRGTAYQHFHDRHQLVRAAVETVGAKLLEALALPTELEGTINNPFEDRVLEVRANSLAEFVSENSELCRVWLFELLSADVPAQDPVAKEFLRGVKAFGRSGEARPGLDADVYAIIALGGYLLWPIWSHTAKLSPAKRKASAKRFVTEFLRLCLYGAMDPALFPRTEALVQRNLGISDAPA